MRLVDQPEWVQRVYWYFNGPVGHAQPRAQGYLGMSASGAVSFLIIEVVLFCVLMLGLWCIKKFITEGEVAKWVSYIWIAIIGGTMFLKLLAFAGVM
jgi:hypothetical protein